MKKKLSIVLGIVAALVILFGFKKTSMAASYKAQLILDSYTVAEDYKLGEDTSVSIVFKNTDPSYFIRNVLVNCSSSDNTVIPVEGKSNQFFVDSIKPGETVTLDIPIVITHSDNGYATMTFNVEYMSDESRWSASSYIVFPVAEEGSSLVLKNVNVPAEVNKNSNTLISTYFLNSSDKDMFNTEFVIKGEIAGGEKSAALGTVSSKRNTYGEVYVSFDTEGKRNITLSIRYEDANGETHEEEIGQYALNVKDNSVGISAPTTSVSTEDTSVSSADNSNAAIGNLSISTLLLIASGVIVLIIIVVVVINVTRKRK